MSSLSCGFKRTKFKPLIADKTNVITKERPSYARNNLQRIPFLLQNTTNC